MRKLPTVLSLFTSMMGLMATGAALADEERTGAPYFFVADRSSAEALPLKETKAKVSIAGVIAHVRVSQVYANEGAQPIEAVYVFPGSTRAAVFGMEMKIGERTIVAEIAKRKDARAKYERAKSEGKAASLLEQERPNVFRMNVANIMPGDRIEVQLDYTELLVPEQGVYELVYPTVVGPRFTGESAQEEGWTANPHLKAGEAPPYRWSLSARISAGMAIGAINSPTHRISPRFDAAGNADVEVDDEQGGNRDFILRYRLDGDRIETGVLLYEGAKEKFFTAILQPPKRIVPAMIPPREYLFIVDVSGSMGGFPIETAKKLMQDLLGGLRSEDRFNVLLFSGGSEVMADASVPATQANLQRAVHIVDRMRGGGGTAILQALRRALAMPRSKEMSSTMVVITDGYVSVEKEAFREVRSNLGEANLFAFGIGSSVNRHLIEGLAREGMGRPFVVTRPSDAGAVAQRFREYVESPVLTGIELELDGLDAYDVEPAQLPDLFGERPLVVMGKYRGDAKGTIRISGTNGQGPFSRSLQVEAYRPSDDLIALEYLWARDRIARLSEDEEEAITKLGLEHHLMTAFTSFVAVDSVVRNTDGRRVTVRQPLPMPEGVGNDAIGDAISGRMGKMGTKGMMGMNGGAGGIGGLGTRGYGRGGGGFGTGRSGSVDLGGSTRGSVVMGSLDRPSIQRVIRRNMARIRYCYEKQLAKNPNLAGKITIRIVIGEDGKVTRAEIERSTVGDATLEQCLLSVVQRLVFPRPSGGGTVVVTYPFTFAPR